MDKIFQKYVVVLLGSISAFLLYQMPNDPTVIAQNEKDISITLENTSFVLTNSTASKLKVTVSYEVENKTLEDERVNGVMKVYASNGTLVRYSSFPDGFLANETGVVEFKTTLRDPNLTNIVANVTMFDFEKENVLSNSIAKELSLQKPVDESGPT